MTKRMLLLAIPLFFLLAPTLVVLWVQPDTRWMGVSFLCGASAGMFFALGVLAVSRVESSAERRAVSTESQAGAWDVHTPPQLQSPHG